MNHSTHKFAKVLAAAVLGGALLCAAPVYAASISHPAASALATGHWVKVKVPAEGICQISYDDLRSWGFSDPTAVKVFGYGPFALQHNEFRSGENTDIYPTWFEHNADRVVFYGAANRPVITGLPDNNKAYYKIDTQRGHYTKDSYYLLTDRAYPSGVYNVESIPYQNISSVPLRTSLCVEFSDIDRFNKCQGGTEYLDREVSQGEKVSVTFPVKDFKNSDDNTVTAVMTLAMFTGMGTDVAGTPFTWETPGLTQTVNGNLRWLYYNTYNSGYHYSPMQTYVSLKGSADGEPVADGEYTFTGTMPSRDDLKFMAYDRSYIYYERENIVPDGGVLMMNFPKVQNAQQTFAIRGVKYNDARILDVTNPSEVRPFDATTDASTGEVRALFPYAYNLSYSGSDTQKYRKQAGRIAAFSINSVFPEAEFAGQVDNQNIHGDETPDMVIITTAELRPYAEELAEAHRTKDGLKVNVYLQDAVYNEFSYGNRAAMGIRRLAKMLYDRSKSKPGGTQFRYLLLYGPCIYDNLGVELDTGRENIPAFAADGLIQPEDKYEQHLIYSSDTYFGYVDSNFSASYAYKTLPLISVGRIPASNGADAMVVNKKILAYMNADIAPDAYSRALAFSDDGDSNQHLKQSLEVVDLLRQETPITVYQPHNLIFVRKNDLNEMAMSRISEALRTGVGFFSFTGHGNAQNFTREGIYGVDVLNNTSYNVQPYAHLSTCDSYVLDRNIRNIGEQMFFKADGGAIAVSGACRSVYMVQNQILNTAIAKVYTNAAPGATVGDIWLKGNQEALRPYSVSPSPGGERLQLRNTWCYNLCGDPALRLPVAAHHTAFISTINNTEVIKPGDAEGATVTVPARSKVEFAGYVTANGTSAVDASFNGKALIEFYEASHTVNTIVKDSEDKKEEITLDETLLTSVRVPVTNGRFSGSVVMPEAYYGGAASRIMVTAVSNDDPVDGRMGYSNALILNASDKAELPGDMTLPVIDRLYIDGHENGSDVPESFTLHADITVGDGGLSTGNVLGAGSRVLLDNLNPVSGVNQCLTMNADGTATLSLPVTDLTDGGHSLTLIVKDNLGNSVEHTISFMVRNTSASAVLTADTDVARTSIELTTDADFETAGSRLLITDADGNTVFSVAEPSLPYRWELRDSRNKNVRDGRYSAVLIARNGTSYLSSAPLVFTVIR